jgi:hypothetical protein
MKVYTEINYAWGSDGDMHVTSEKSYNHEGEIASCLGGDKPSAPVPTRVPFTPNPVAAPQVNPYIKQGGIGSLPEGQNAATQMGLPQSTGAGGMLPWMQGRALPKPPGAAPMTGPQSPAQMMQPRARTTPIMGRM